MAQSIPCDSWLRTPSQPSYVNIGDLDISGNQVTIEASFNTTLNNNGFGDLVSKHSGTIDANYLLRAYSGEITTTNGYYKALTLCPVSPNKTYHAAMVYDGSSLKFYRNGFLMDQVPASGNLILNNWQTWIGFFQPQTLNENFIGYINEVRIWNIARSQADIRAYMGVSLPNPTTQPGLLAYYTFNTLLNKQGNSVWNGTLGGSAVISQTNPQCNLVVDSCNLTTVAASFTAPDTVCINTPVNIMNTSTNATSYYWNFCVADINAAPTGTNLGNVGGLLQRPVYIDYVYEGGNYYGFLTNNFPGKLLRLDFGNSLLNNPTVTDLGTVGGTIPNNTEGIQVVKNEGKWYVIIVGGEVPSSIPSIVKIELGPTITNNTPVGTNWGNLGNLAYPHDLYVFSDNGNWYGFTVNTGNNTITRFDFTTSFSNTPIATNLGNIGNLSGPTGLHPIKDNNVWYLFVTNATSSSLTRLNFGTSLLNTPTGQNLGNINGLFHTSWDIYIMKFCGKITGFVINGDSGYNDLIKLDFNNNLLNTPTAVSFGNVGNCSFPHCISKIFRVGPDLYSFIPNVNNNTLTRLRFTGCTNSSIPNSSAQTPPPVTYSTPGTYNINLTVDDGLPTQSTFCKQVVVKNCLTPDVINDYTEVLALDICKNNLSVADATEFNVGDTVLLIQMKGAVIDSTNTGAFGSITDYKNAGNYEFNYVKSKTGNVIELKNVLTRQYDIPNGKVQLVRVPYYQNFTVTSELTCLPWDGSKGGIVVVNVQNALELNADINVSGKGFKGGIGYNSGNATLNCFQNGHIYPITSNTIAGQKGESIASLSQNIICGKGSPANAGGGGLGHNSGGGGGANGGAGGLGGYQLEPCGNSPYDNRGIGGHNLLYTTAANKIFLGGGGGAGQADNPGNTPPHGGAGGGMVILTANSIKSNSFKIIANGNSGSSCSMPPSTDCHDGMGGGGAGGSVLLNITQIVDNTIVENKGGRGADMVGSVPLGGRIGAGGGGGGGLLFVKNGSLPANLINANTGGINGVLATDGNSSWGATPGQSGTTLFNLIIPVATVPFKPNIDSVRIKDSAIGCSSFDFQGFAYTNTSPVNSWQWYFGDGGTANTQNTSHSYSSVGTFSVKLVVTDVNGCKDSLLTTITASLLTLDAGPADTICSTTPFVLQGSTIGGSTYSWSPAVVLNDNTLLNPTANINTSTTFYFTATNPQGCSLTDSVHIEVRSAAAFTINGPFSICRDSSVQLSAGGGDLYLWQPAGSLNNPAISKPVATPSGPTIYSVRITDTICNNSTDLSTVVTVLPSPNIRAFKSNDLDCTTDFSQLTASGGVTYSWLPASSLNNPAIATPIARPTATTQYIVSGKDIWGCVNTDSIIVYVTTANKGGYLMPSGFTPNNDGKNDCYGIKYWGVLNKLQFSIYNRWGERIFYTTDPSRCWDGTYKGIMQDMGAFIYVISAKTACDNAVFRKGTFILIR